MPLPLGITPVPKGAHVALEPYLTFDASPDALEHGVLGQLAHVPSLRGLSRLRIEQGPQARCLFCAEELLYANDSRRDGQAASLHLEALPIAS